MGRRTKAATAHINNLGKAEASRKATVEDVSDDEDTEFRQDDLLKHGFFMADEWGGTSYTGSDDDYSSESDEEEIAEEELHALKNEAAIHLFYQILSEAQALAVKAEQEALGTKPKRRRHYTGNAERTKRYHAQKRRALASTGQQFITSMFAKKMPDSERTTEAQNQSRADVIELESDSEASDIGEDDVEASLRRLFPENLVPSPFPDIVHEEQQQPTSDPVAEMDRSVADARKKVEELLHKLRNGQRPQDDSPENETDQLLDGLCYKDFPSLRRARASLSVKAKDKKLDVFFRSRITAMVATLNFYLDPELSFTWRESSLLAAKALGHGVGHAHNLWKWIKTYLHSGKLPLHRYGTYSSSILEDEDFSRDIQLHLTEIAKKGYIRAQDIVDYVATPEVQEHLGTKARGIHVRTARRWLHKLSWRYSQKKKGMYIDGHEREDVVEYHQKFVKRWKEYEKRFVIYDNNGQVLSTPTGFPIPQWQRAFRLILVTHDESTFYKNDRRKTQWVHERTKAVAEKKGEGQSLMVSNFLTIEWGRLSDGNEEAHLFFKAGKNRDGYFSADDLIEQVDRAIDIFEEKTKGFATGLFIFDNAPSHQKRAPDALSARKMPKGAHATWRHHKDRPKMRRTTFGENNAPQDFYYPDDHPSMPGWFKGMEQIIRERGLWPEGGLNAQCEGFKCKSGKTVCCCRRLLFCQPDFTNHKSHLEEFITSRGHICDFYPKYHCELNFIEQYWGATKLVYRSTPKTLDMKQMEENVKNALDSVPLLQIQRYANRAARFISAYGQGLSGPEAAWANRKYHGHRTLPPDMAAKLKKEHQKKYGASDISS